MFQRTRSRGALLSAALTLALAAPAAADPGAVYTQTQDPAGNEVVVFARAADGTLTEVQRIATGGVGAPATPPFGFPILDSQGGVELTDNGRLVFAVNAGSGTLSSFRAGPHGQLRLVDEESTGGALPVSVDSSRGLVYVVNEVSGTISGFTYDSHGELTPIAGSIESLATPGVDGIAAQIGFDPKGRTLYVTERGPSQIDAFAVLADGTTGPAVATPTSEPTPFGFAFSRDRLIVSHAGVVGNPPDFTDPAQFVGSASSWRADGTSLEALDAASTGARATCWVVATRNGKYAFTTNTLTADVSTLRVGSDGGLTLLGTTPTSTPPVLAGGAARGDAALSRNDRYLYVLSALDPAGATIDAYRVGSDGSLTLIQSLPHVVRGSASGLAAG